MTNTIFEQFKGRPDKFEEIFGFSMYDENGDLNYDAMITDFYCATDNHNKRNLLWHTWDSVSWTEDLFGTHGTTMKQREYRWEMYLKEHGIEVDVQNNITVTAENYEEIALKGDIIVGIHPCILYNENGKMVKKIDGGHAMTVTGTTDDGMRSVSSWGEIYYIKFDSDEYDRMQFQQVIY